MLSLSGSPLFQCQSYQSVRLVSHKQRNVQHVIIQLQIIQREPHPEPDLIREQFLEFFQALAGRVDI